MLPKPFHKHPIWRLPDTLPVNSYIPLPNIRIWISKWKLSHVKKRAHFFRTADTDKPEVPKCWPILVLGLPYSGCLTHFRFPVVICYRTLGSTIIMNILNLNLAHFFQTADTDKLEVSKCCPILALNIIYGGCLTHFRSAAISRYRIFGYEYQNENYLI